VWDAVWHESGDFIATASMDHTARVLDVHSQRTRTTLRGHVDSVNSVAFQPATHALLTASGDKTVSLWDIRSGLCAQTLYGHQNAVLCASFNARGDGVVSSDADGVVKLWDARMVCERGHIASKDGHPINDVQFDRSGALVLAASDAGVLRYYSASDLKLLGELDGHEDAVQAFVQDPHSRFIVSASSDATFRVWS
jgi:WD40 repeat protein